LAGYLIIDFELEPPDPTLDSKIWIFAEDLYRTSKASGIASMPLDEVDKVKSHLRLLIHSKKYARQVEKSVRELLVEHFLLPRAHLSQVVES
jgi:hypothetical protein